MPLTEISKIVIPGLNGNPAGIYSFKDTYARQLLAGGINFKIVWNGLSTPTTADIPNTVSILYNNTVYTGGLAPTDADPMTFYLVKTDSNGNDNFAEYVVATSADGTQKYWEKIGETGQSFSNLGSLAYMDTINIEKGLGVNVVGENATVSASDNNTVTFDNNHTTDSVLGSDTTFNVTDPTYTLTPTKGKITLTQGNLATIQTGSTSVVTGINNTRSTKETFLKADSGAFTRKKIKTTSLRGVTGESNSQTVTIIPTTHKLKTNTFTPVEISSISNYVSAVTQKLTTTQITGVGGTTSVNSYTSTDNKKLETDTFYEVEQITADNATNSEWKDTTANLDFHMWSASSDGTSGVLANADTETLVVSFKTMPSLKLADDTTTYATGDATKTGNGAAFVTGVNTTAITVATAADRPVVVATGGLSAMTETQHVGGTVTTGLSATAIPIPVASSSDIRYATGEICTTQEDASETNGGTVVTAVPDSSVLIPAIDSGTTNVLIPELDTATANDSDVNVVTKVTTSDHTDQAYTDIVFDTANVLNSASISQQPTFTASVTSDDNGSVLMGVSMSQSQSGSVTANSNHPVTAITGLGTATAAAPTITFNKDLKKVVLWDDLGISTESHPATRYLNFVSPTDGTITLEKNGSPTVVELQYSYDGLNWTDWDEDASTGNRTLAVTANTCVYVRNKSVVSTGFSKQTSSGSLQVDYYHFSVPTDTEVNGIVESLLCQIPELGKMTGSAFQRLFHNQRIKGKPIIISNYIPAGGLFQMFYCNTTDSLLNEVELRASNISANYSMSSWLYGCASTGTFYCKSDLDIATNSNSGIPSGWTRVNL